MGVYLWAELGLIMCARRASFKYGAVVMRISRELHKTANVLSARAILAAPRPSEGRGGVPNPIESINAEGKTANFD